ncbi:hypothetical protein SAMN06297358_0677 [Pedobacter xixiisoli]|uniref:Uncharacterized protein n=1 Tax=Pedobacter xixiisoli TaxID=1476464 RepID=A0A285ZS17_9SPHI|nr:hypothetical protein SAMN06297358_0677 [Pedobacter xixiisoli]
MVLLVNFVQKWFNYVQRFNSLVDISLSYLEIKSNQHNPIMKKVIKSFTDYKTAVMMFIPPVKSSHFTESLTSNLFKLNR